jgi:CHAT domain-containing protein
MRMASTASSPLAPRLLRSRSVKLLVLVLVQALATGALLAPAWAAPTVPDVWARADTQLTAGDLREAEQLLRELQARSDTEALRAGTALRLGAVLLAGGHTERAKEQLEIAAGLATTLPPSDQLRLSEARGKLAARSSDYQGAEGYFEQAARAAAAAGLPLAQARERINQLRARFDRKDLTDIDATLNGLHAEVTTLPRSDAAATLLIAAADLQRTAVKDFLSPVSMRKNALEELSLAIDYATTPATRAYALGFLGALYEDEQRWREAAQLTSRAIFLAQEARAGEQLYRWEWQAARIDRQQGDLAASRQSLDRALTAVSPVRSDIIQSSRRAYATLIEPLYLDYADVNLRAAAALSDASEAQQAVLRGVRDQLESLKQAEIQDYFDNQCVVSSQDPRQRLDLAHTAIIYPILLPDRIEVLIEVGNSLRRFATPISVGEATQTTRRLRLALERSTSDDAYLAPAQSLYKWLLKDAEPWLESSTVDTLVFIPSAALRTIPLGALHDGERFLIERYAVATTPAVSLLGAVSPMQLERLLLGGLTEGVQGFSQLPSVAQELKSLSTLFPSQSLQDESFKLSTVESQLLNTDYSVAHLATHGEFSADHRQSFILTYDSRLTMDTLKQTLAKRAGSLDLLVLSACRTAAGDDRAALGLAGVAIQAGAKSALASLWYISDRATAELMGNFYRGLKNPLMSKAESLRQAQLMLLSSPQYRHPSYWAPYLLIGNWL